MPPAEARPVFPGQHAILMPDKLSSQHAVMGATVHRRPEGSLLAETLFSRLVLVFCFGSRA